MKIYVQGANLRGRLQLRDATVHAERLPVGEARLLIGQFRAETPPSRRLLHDHPDEQLDWMTWSRTAGRTYYPLDIYTALSSAIVPMRLRLPS